MDEVRDQMVVEGGAHAVIRSGRPARPGPARGDPEVHELDTYRPLPQFAMYRVPGQAVVRTNDRPFQGRQIYRSQLWILRRGAPAAPRG